MELLYAVGRFALASLFILGGINKIVNPDAMVEMMVGAGLPLPALLLWAVIALELAGGMLVAFGSTVGLARLAQAAALALAVHTLAVNALFHDFWNYEGLRGQLEISLFFKNLSIVGGLLMVSAQPVAKAQSSTR